MGVQLLVLLQPQIFSILGSAMIAEKETKKGEYEWQGYLKA
jgi:hypothetical protein